MMQALPVDQRVILVVDADTNHNSIIRQSLQDHPNYRLVVLQDGETALDFLHQRAEYTTAERPHLILLDLNLPGKGGREVLTDVKADPHLRRIPIIVLTTSDAPEDIFRTYVEQGNCYIIKAPDSERLSQIIKRIEAFWLEIVTLPQE